MPVKPSEKCQLLLSAIEHNFFQFFSDKRIAQREWKSIQDRMTTNPLNTKFIDLAQLRIKNYIKVTKACWQDPAHIVVRGACLTKIKTLSEAVKLFEGAQYYYESNLRKYIKGNLIINCEISYDINENKIKTYNIHAHVLCEKAAYLTAKDNTRHWRQGSDQSKHEISTRLCERKRDQSNNDYVNCVFMYNSKWTVNQGDSRVKKSGKKSLIHRISKTTIDYAHLKSICYIRLPHKQDKKPTKVAKKLLKNLAQLAKHYKNWLLLDNKTKQQAKKAVCMVKVLKNIKKQLLKVVSRPKAQGSQTAYFSNSS